MISFYRDEEIVLLNTAEIIRIVRSALSKIDPRLIDHGERVGYIAAKIREECPDRSDIDPTVLFILCALHDIGAYKTEEIDDMVRFETETVFDHALYGYLFLKNTTHLSAYAEAVYYHHTDYRSPALRACPCARYAQLIHLADRADILLGAGARGLGSLRAMAGTRFLPADVEALFRAEDRFHMTEQLRSGAYLREAEEMALSLDIKSHEIMDYLRLLVYAIDFRSPYTVTHTADTTLISLETGRLLGMGEHDLQAMYLGAFLHDVGKIAIPHTILEKPGKLTAAEFTIIQRHIPEGEQILRGVVSDEICDIALRHHEKMDGSGYALGLRGDELTLPQRIVGVADILSALSQKRSYKEAFPKSQVVSILTDMKERGQLCPLVVDTACLNYDRILRNTELSHDPVKTLYSDMVREYAQRRGA